MLHHDRHASDVHGLTVDPVRGAEPRSESDTRTASHMQVRVNDSAMKPVYETPAFGKDDNAIARHGIHGLYALYNIDIPAADLRKGDNIIYLTQRKASGSSNAVMYDNLRLPSPPVSSSSS
ncbi:hypothetical protein Mp_7g05450 [Marchantia polymorpha subsp. ruderalis]|uniref:Rhamnogalacturonan lyase domain-containing protein n=2 Tax=Marchantia polymorpha TaxID=3197 RepID=A0AAF6BWF0_MARPO|nr:hypothetical protein MARPO_0218s0013 [Marchantia polymorpha]BBN16334.1 hypothetical protein Mp_7g05450 [Marchantia polymorpha subsp. ruderalis]|eukprot:PTQ27139.1 hypothetical protein MARPO_0218s0013 [Marchantia polymorpha]